MSYSKIFFYACISFVLGIFLSSFFKIPQPTILFFIILIFLMALFYKKKGVVIFLLFLLFFSFGVFRNNQAESNILNDELMRLNNYYRPLTFEGTIVREPDVRENNTKLTVKIEKIYSESINPDVSKIKGLVLITTKREGLFYGDKIRFTGRLKAPKVYTDFNYRDYLAKEGIYSETYYPKIEIISRNNGNKIYEKILLFKNQFRKTILTLLPSPHNFLLLGIVLGDKKQISPLWQEKLNITGTRHIVAVSGMNITILISILMAILLGLGFNRKEALFLNLFLVIFYIILIGLQPSAIRAGIMGIILLLAQAVGRLSDGWRMVIFALSIMLLFNPLLLRYDIGFQLSFLAVCGIIFLSPVFNHWLKFIPEEKFWNLKEAIVITLSAQVFTLPLLIFNFGYFSVISPFVNAIIDPLIYYITGLGLFLGSMGKILMPLGKILAIPAYVLLDIVIKTINFFSSFDWAYKTFKISWVWLSFSYLLLFIVTKKLNKRYNSPLLLKLKKL